MSDDNTPKIIIQGDTTEWTISSSTYPASEWTLTYTFINMIAKITLSGTDQDDDHLFQISADDSADYVPGNYRWTAKVTDIATGLEVHTVGAGNSEILVDLSDRETHDSRSWAEIALDNVEAVIANRATMDQESYSIAGRALSRTPLTDLINFRRYLQGEVSDQNDKLNGTNSKKAVVRF